MVYTPRTIAFLCELLHPPQVPDPGPIQRVHNQLFQTGSPAYRSFTVTAEGAILSNPTTQPGAASSAAILHDRFQFREELTGAASEDFIGRIEETSKLLLTERNVQIFTAQVVTIRSLVNPKQFRDSRAFLKEGMFHFGSELSSFGRDPQLYGMRLVFPPTEQEPHAFTLRVESFANDPRSVFIENVGSFGPTVIANGLDSIGANVRRTYDFLVERALPFLAQFDVRQQA
jgi:hypothetical protein